MVCGSALPCKTITISVMFTAIMTRNKCENVNFRSYTCKYKVK